MGSRGGGRRTRDAKVPRDKALAAGPASGAPAPTEFTVGGVTLRTFGAVTPAVVARVLEALRGMPESVLDAMAREGITVALGYQLSDVAPDLAGKSPRGWSEGKTFEDVDGFYRPGRKSVVVTETIRLGGPGGLQVGSGRVANVLRHEVGHAADDALGYPSTTDAFRRAYDADVAATSAADRKYLGYYLQGGHAGPSEAFAEVFAQLHGGGGDGYNTLLSKFPRSADYIRKAIRK